MFIGILPLGAQDVDSSVVEIDTLVSESLVDSLTSETLGSLLDDDSTLGFVDSSTVLDSASDDTEEDSLELATGSISEQPDTLAGISDSSSADSVVAKPSEPKYEPPNRPMSDNPRALRYNGIYLTGYSASSSKRVGELIEESRGTPVNGFIMDMKDDQGHLTYRSQHPLARTIGSGTRRLRDPKQLVDRLHEEGLIATARVVCFKDPILAGYAGPDSTFPYAVHDSATAQPWKQDNGEIWANPYHPEVREYLLYVVEELVCFGFDQIQLDYIRFPSDGDIGRCKYPVKIDSLNRADMIGEFLAGVRKEVDEQDVSLAADVFGWVPWLNGNRVFKIGQDYDIIASHVDVICPMLYASHFPADFKAEHKERRAYEIYLEGTRKAVERRGERSTGVQPYIQGFRWRAPYFGTRYIAEQLEASSTEGAVGWIVWNSRNKYDELWETLDSLRIATGMSSR